MMSQGEPDVLQVGEHGGHEVVVDAVLVGGPPDSQGQGGPHSSPQVPGEQVYALLQDCSDLSLLTHKVFLL